MQRQTSRTQLAKPLRTVVTVRTSGAIGPSGCIARRANLTDELVQVNLTFTGGSLPVANRRAPQLALTIASRRNG